MNGVITNDSRAIQQTARKPEDLAGQNSLIAASLFGVGAIDSILKGTHHQLEKCPYLQPDLL